MSDHDEAGAEPADKDAPGPELRGDDFVARLVDDPKSPPQTTLISGYLGASDEEGHTRVYFNPELSDYVDVPNGDILHTEQAGEGPLAVTLVWITRDAQVLHGQAGAARQRAGFFEGRVWKENFGATAATAAPVTHAMRTADGCFPTDNCPTPVTNAPRCFQPFDFATPRINPTPYVGPQAFPQPMVQNRFVQGGPEVGPAPSVVICAQSAVVCRPVRTLRMVECIPPTGIQAICGPIPRSLCPPVTVTAGQWLQGSGGGTDTVVYGSGGGTDTVVSGSGGGTDTVIYGSTGGTDTVHYGSGQGTDTVWYGSGQGTDTVWYGSGTGTDTVVYGSGGGTDTVYSGSGGGTDTVYYGSGQGTDTVWYGSSQGTDTVWYGSGQGTDTVWYGSGMMTDTVYYGSGGGADTVVYGAGGGYAATVWYGGTPGIFPTRICPTRLCGFPRLRTQVGPCGFPTIGPRGCASAVDACPTRFCPQW